MITNYYLPSAKEIEEIILFQAFKYNWQSRFPENLFGFFDFTKMQ